MLFQTATQRIRRRAAAVVEFAVIAPFFVALVIGAMEVSRGIWAREALADAARRACRTGAHAGATNAKITQEVNDILNKNNLNSNGTAITILVNDQAADVSTATQEDKISVKVSVPVSKIMLVTAIFLKSTQIESETVVMLRSGNSP